MNYGRLAKSYQFISRMVFGGALLDAQRQALSELVYPCNLLIIGGGDGEILKYLEGFKGRLDFVEISEKMVQEAQSKTQLSINWHVQDIFSFKTENKYDVIFLPFVLDNFTTQQCSHLIFDLKQMLQRSGQLVVIDFTQTPNFWQKVLLKIMYSFFWLFADVKVQKIPDIEQVMEWNKMHKVLEVKSLQGFVESKYYCDPKKTPVRLN